LNHVSVSDLPPYAQKLVEPWSSAIAFLFHIDFTTEFQAVFLPENNTAFVDALAVLLANQIREFDTLCQLGPEHIDEDQLQSVAEPLTHLLFLLLRFVEGSDVARHRLKRMLLPDSTDRSRPLNFGTNVHNILVRLLTAALSEQVKEVLGELLWLLCDADAHRFVHYVSYGSGAGVLMKKHMLSLPAPTAKSVDDQGRPLANFAVTNINTNDDDEIIPAVNPMTGALFTGNELEESQPAGADMTDEEKLAENARVLEALEKLNRTGMMQVGVPPQLLAEQEELKKRIQQKKNNQRE
jgi:hypothetical protein